jgi:antitoxin MazE
MSTFTKTRLIKIGNSQGVRIPKLLIDQIGLGSEVEIEAQSGQLVIRPAKSPREGWDRKFQDMATIGDDALLDSGLIPATSWEAAEWEW